MKIAPSNKIGEKKNGLFKFKSVSKTISLLSKRQNKERGMAAREHFSYRERKVLETTLVSPDKIMDLIHGSDSTALDSNTIQKWQNYIHSIALQVLTLYFTENENGTRQVAMEEAFGKRYASSMIKVHRRGLYAVILFMFLTTFWDYIVLLDQTTIYKLEGRQDVPVVEDSWFENAFVIIVLIRYCVIVPVLLVALWNTYRVKSTYGMPIVWLSNVVLGCFPLVYNNITSDFGVSWLCLYVVYIYNCTPTRFMANGLLCLLVISSYTVLVLVAPSEVSFEYRSKETLYLALFYVLITIPSYSTEFAVRVNYVSELLLKSQHVLLKMEQTRSKLLLHSMLPVTVVNQLKAGRQQIADEFIEISVLFAEVCDFDAISCALQPSEVVEMLNTIFSTFDQLVDVHGVHKVETIGAVYMVSGGCPDPMENHADVTANLAIAMLQSIPTLREQIGMFQWGDAIGQKFNIRIGINSGGVMAGVVGTKNPRFKLFGDTVNVASRMETTCLSGSIQITERTNALLKSSFVTEYRGQTIVKGKGNLKTFFLRGHKDNKNPVEKPRYSVMMTVQDLDKVVYWNDPTKENEDGRAIALAYGADVSPRSPQSSRSNSFRNSVTKAIDVVRNVSLTQKSNRENSRTCNSPRQSRVRRTSTAAQNTKAFIELEENTETAKEEVFLDKRTVMFYVHGLTKPSGLFYDFEVSYRRRNRSNWFRFFRRSLVLMLFVKPCITVYQSYNLAQDNDYDKIDLIFWLNFALVSPTLIVFLLISFTKVFKRHEQLLSTIVVVIMAVFFNVESSFNSVGHGYLSAVALYQCHFSILPFLVRCCIGFGVVVMYLVTNLTDVATYFREDSVHGKSQAEDLKIWRNALYIFIFFGAQAWIVFNNEYKQRENHQRSLVLSRQQGKLVGEEQLVTKLLKNLLPEAIVMKLKASPSATIAEYFDSTTILYTDMVHFTAFSSKVTAMKLVEFLNDMYTQFDMIIETRDIYKVEIIGDAYFVVGGCPIICPNHAVNVLQSAFEMLDAMPSLRKRFGDNINIRIGIHTGPVVAGVVGIKDPRYHLFGETVAIAQNLEASGEAGKVHVSETTIDAINAVNNDSFFFTENLNRDTKKTVPRLQTYFAELKN